MPHAPTDTLSSRHQAVRRSLAELRLDALVVTSLPNVLYLTNFSGTSAIAILTPERLIFITDSRYVTDLHEMRGTPHECPAFDLVTVEGAYDTTVAQVLAAMPAARVGFEAAHLSVSRHTWLQNTVRRPASAKASAVRRSFSEGRSLTRRRKGDTTYEMPELVPTERIVERVRVRKDGYELGLLREAALRLSAVAKDVFTTVRPGQSERDVALDIDWRIRRAGFERSAFDTIVAAGPNAALPHARPGERRLTEGDLVVLDFGGVYDSYCVDLTRTVSIGRASALARQVHAAVLDGHDQAIAAVRPGESRFAIDAAARAALHRAGMAAAFGHGTGHGLGIEVHEDPRIVRRRPDVDARDEAVAPGMVFTIEPGAYFPGWGGVRIEDDVVVTDNGVEVLTDVTTELLEL